VRAAPNRAMVVDRRVSPWVGGGTLTAVVRNAMRTAVARSPVWMRGVKGGGGGGESATLGHGRGGWGERGERWWPEPFMAARWHRWRGKTVVGPEFGAMWRENGEERGGPRAAGDSSGGVPTTSRPTTAWPRHARAARSIRVGEGGVGSLARGAWPAVGEGGRREAHGPTGEKKRSGPSPDEQ
jgi:hypothetical protein